MSKNKDKSNGEDPIEVQLGDIYIKVGVNYGDHLVVLGIKTESESFHILLPPDNAVILAAQINQQAGYLKTNK